ncbi:MAG: hypothetical protein ACJ70Q_07385 [Nitrososphaera sp.]
MQKRLNVSEDKCAPETATTDESIIKTETIKAPVMHEELIVERRPPGESSTKVTRITEAPFESTIDMKAQISDDENRGNKGTVYERRSCGKEETQC